MVRMETFTHKVAIVVGCAVLFTAVLRPGDGGYRGVTGGGRGGNGALLWGGPRPRPMRLFADSHAGGLCVFPIATAAGYRFFLGFWLGFLAGVVGLGHAACMAFRAKAVRS